MLICPKCESTDVEVNWKGNSFLWQQSYVCKKCGYSGQLFPEIAEPSAEKHNGS